MAGRRRRWPARRALTYSRGQNVSPAYEGWEEDPDGSQYFVFGYMNRNWEEELDVPVGPDNGFDKGGVDQGQPTHFLPRRNRFVFRVPVPKGFTEKDELVWTLTTKGKTEKAYASLVLDYKIDGVVRASETGALGAGSSSPEVRANKAPTLEVQGQKKLTAKVGEPVTLVGGRGRRRDSEDPRGGRGRGGEQRRIVDHAVGSQPRSSSRRCVPAD